MFGSSRTAFTRTPTFRQRTITRTRSAVLAVASDPYSLTSITDVVLVNGSQYRTVFDVAQRTVTSTTPENRTSQTVFDQKGRAVQLAFGGLTPVATQYDTRGRVLELRQANRVTAFGYDGHDRLARLTDPLQRTVEFTLTMRTV